MVKQLILFSALTIALPSLGNGVAQAVRTKKITSWQELEQATNYLFSSLAKMLAKGTSIEYSTDFFYFANPQDEPHLYPADHLLTFNIEAGIDYFNTMFVELHDSEDPIGSVQAAEEFLNWRNYAVERADVLLKRAKTLLAEDPNVDIPAMQNIIAQMDWIKENLFSMPRDDTPDLFRLLCSGCSGSEEVSMEALKIEESTRIEIKDFFPFGLNIRPGSDPSIEPEGGMIHGNRPNEAP